MINNSISNNRLEISALSDIPGLQFHLDANQKVYGLDDALITSTNGAQVKCWGDIANNLFRTDGSPLCAESVFTSEKEINNYYNDPYTISNGILSSYCTKYPTISTNAINGKNAIYYKNAGSCITNSLSTVNLFNFSILGRAFFMVFRLLPDPYPNYRVGLMVFGSGGLCPLSMYPPSYPPTYQYAGFNRNAYTLLSRLPEGGGGTDWFSLTPMVPNKWKIVIVNQEKYIKAVSQGSYGYSTITDESGIMNLTGSSGIIPSSFAENGNEDSDYVSVNIGCSDGVYYQDFGPAAHVLIAECGFYHKQRGLTPLEKNQLMKYLKNKYNIA